MAEGVDELVAPEPASTIGDVIARMEEIEVSLPETDGVAIFNRLYLSVTRAIQNGVRDVSFNDEEFVSRLDVIFSNLYFRAVADAASGRACPAAWQPLFEARGRSGPRKIQFALCGMNAHINHDLPVAVKETWVVLDKHPVAHSPQHRDFRSVNEVLRGVEAEVKTRFIRGTLEALVEATGGEGDKLAIWSIAGAREGAWHHGLTLYRLRDHEELERAYLDGLSCLAEIAGRGLLL